MTESLNGWWCEGILQELESAGVRHVVACPGNRDVPLLHAITQRPQLRLLSHVDERSAAFIALGMSKARKQPCAVITTSGSAVSNCHPAVSEAFYAGIPLIIISADRPSALQHCGAPQTMTQPGIFGSFTSGECALPDPSPEAWNNCRTHLRTALSAGLSRPGPVHINVPLDDPLVPQQDPEWQAPLRAPATPIAATPRAHSACAWDDIFNALSNAKRGVVVVGPACPLADAQVINFAQYSGWPVLVDAPGTLRQQDHPCLIHHADTMLSVANEHWQPDFIIRLGPAPISRPAWTWLQQQACPVLRCDELPIEGDFCHKHFWDAGCPSDALWDRIQLACTPAAASWQQQWSEANQRIEQARYHWLTTAGWCDSLAAALACSANTPAHLHVANSLAVRHANLHVAAGAAYVVTANRGLNGIDGTIATAIGIAHSHQQQTRLVCGDLAFLHDLPALAALNQHPIALDIVVINNNGGGIFDLLPVAQHENLAPLVKTPQNISLEHSAKQFGLAYVCARNAAEFTAALATQPTNTPRVIEARVAADSVADSLRGLQQQLQAACLTS